MNELINNFKNKRGWLHGLVALSLGYIFTGAQDWSTWADYAGQKHGIGLCIAIGIGILACIYEWSQALYVSTHYPLAKNDGFDWYDIAWSAIGAVIGTQIGCAWQSVAACYVCGAVVVVCFVYEGVRFFKASKY